MISLLSILWNQNHLAMFGVKFFISTQVLQKCFFWQSLIGIQLYLSKVGHGDGRILEILLWTVDVQNTPGCLSSLDDDTVELGVTGVAGAREYGRIV